jgi:hypothetical protein
MINANTPPKETDAAQQETGEGCPAATCSPYSIYLQWHGDAEPSEFYDGPEPGDVTWAKERIWAHDVKYIRADVVKKLMESVAVRIAADQAAVPYMEEVLKCWDAVREILPENVERTCADS